MAGLKNIKLKILSVKKTSTVTRAMEAVSAVKMRKAQERALSARSYAASALSILERLSATTDFSQQPLMRVVGSRTSDKKTCFIVVTSDKGLAGSLNSAVIRTTEREIARLNLDIQNVVIVGIGRRGADFFASRGYDVHERHENVTDAVSESDIKSVTARLMEWHAAGEIGAAYIVYTNFLSTFLQEATVRQIVPITSSLIRDMVAGIRPARGRYSPAEASTKESAPASYVIEPDDETVISVLLPRLLTIALFHAVLENKASEHSARMVAMKNATDNAKERAKQYTRQFNRIRQASITREISEITSGIEAMR